MLSPFFLPARDVVTGAWVILLLGLVAGVLPATGAMRIKITDALRKA
jgi:ABC-type lipoprotein release transport system permease subunit